MSDGFDGNNDETLDVGWSDPKLMGFCSICNTLPCKAENERWGVCPICHRNDGYANLVNDEGTGASHYMVCETHKTCWAFGANLLSSWMDETHEEREASRKKLKQYRRVKPYHGLIDFAADDRNQQEIDSVPTQQTRKDMNSETESKCAVRACAEVTSWIGNLCDRHRVPGVVFEGPGRTYVVISWYAEHEGARGIIVLNDFALGDLFGGQEAFQAELIRQGFTAIRLLVTPEEFADAKEKVRAAPGRWSGPWSEQYPWETGRPAQYEVN